MLIYRKEWIDNLSICKQIRKWKYAGDISDEEYQTIFNKYPISYSESSFIGRMGAFIFTAVAILAGVGLFMLLAGDTGSGIYFLIIFLGIILYIITEYFIREMNYFRSGVTDALLYSSACVICVGIVLIYASKEYDNFKIDPLVYMFSIFPVLALTALRFADGFLAILAYVCMFVINAILILKLKSFGQMILPFEGMLVSYLAYYYSKKLEKENSKRFYAKPLLMVKVASLVTLYASGNYFVVRQLSEMLLGNTILPGKDIPLAFIFYAYTILIPLIFVWQGIVKKDYTLIRCGLIFEIIGILSIRYYYSIMPVETAMIVGGVFLIVISWLSIRYLKVPRNGISFSNTFDKRDELFTGISSVLISKAGSNLQHSLEKRDEIFKGGVSGGGGAGGEF